MTNFTVYTFNDTHQLTSMLNGVRHFMASSEWSTLAHTALIVLMAFAVIRIRRFDPLTYIGLFFAPVILYIVLFVTPCRINMVDMYSDEISTVSNVPMGVGLPLWLTSLIEKVSIDIIETYITPPQTPSFLEVDYYGQARLMAEVSSRSLWIGPVIDTAREYYENCTIPNMANGLYTPEEVRRSSDIHALIATTNQALFTRNYLVSGNPVETCGAVYSMLDGRISSDASNRTDASKPFGRVKNLFGARGGFASLSAVSIDSIINSMFQGHQDSMEALFKQNLWINAIRQKAGEFNPTLLASIAETESRQFSGTVVAALGYIKQLPKYKTYWRMMLLALIPFCAVFFMAMVGRPWLNWASGLLWVGLWLPTEAAIHAVNVADSIEELRAFTNLAGGYSMETSSDIVKWATDQAALAGMLMLAIPVISAFVIRWIFPTVGTAIAGMLTAVRGPELAYQRAAAGSVERTGKMIMGMDAEKFYKGALEAGDRYANIRSSMNQLQKERTGSIVDSIWGDDPAPRSGEKAIEKGFGTYKVSFKASAQALESAQTSLKEAETDSHNRMRGLVVAAVDEDSKSGGTSRMQKVINSMSEEQRKSFGQSVDSMKKIMDSDKRFDSLTDAEKTSTAMAFSLGLGVGHAGVNVGANTEWRIAAEQAIQKGYESAQTMSKESGEKISLGEAMSRAISKQISGVWSREIGDKQGSGMRFTDQYNEYRALQNSIETARQRVSALTHAQGAGTTFEISPAQQITMLTETGSRDVHAHSEDFRANRGQGMPLQEALRRESMRFTRLATQVNANPTNMENWKNLFTSLESYRLGAMRQGDFGLQKGIENTIGIYEAYYQSSMGARAPLSEVHQAVAQITKGDIYYERPDTQVIRGITTKVPVEQAPPSVGSGSSQPIKGSSGKTPAGSPSAEKPTGTGKRRDWMDVPVGEGAELITDPNMRAQAIQTKKAADEGTNPEQLEKAPPSDSGVQIKVMDSPELSRSHSNTSVSPDGKQAGLLNSHSRKGDNSDQESANLSSFASSHSKK